MNSILVKQASDFVEPACSGKLDVDVTTSFICVYVHLFVRKILSRPEILYVCIV